MGPGSCGHWKDQIFFVENDLKQLLHQKNFSDAGKLRLRFRFRSEGLQQAHRDLHALVHQRLLGRTPIPGHVHPTAIFNPQQGYGWNDDFVLVTAEQPEQGFTVRSGVPPTWTTWMFPSKCC